MASQKTLDEYLGTVRRGSGYTGRGRLRSESIISSSSASVDTSISKLIECLRPAPRPRSVLVCDSLEDARGEAGGCSGGYLELAPVEAAKMLCSGDLHGVGAVALLLDRVDLGDKWQRLLVFWTIRSIPVRVSVVLVLPGLVRLVEERGGEEALPMRHPGEWSWLVTLVSRRIGSCLEAFV